MQYIQHFTAQSIEVLANDINDFLSTYPQYKLITITQIYDSNAMFNRLKVLALFETQGD